MYSLLFYLLSHLYIGWHPETSPVHSEELFVTSGLFQPTLTVRKAVTAAVTISKYNANTLKATVTVELTGGSTTNEIPSEIICSMYIYSMYVFCH